MVKLRFHILIGWVLYSNNTPTPSQVRNSVNLIHNSAWTWVGRLYKNNVQNSFKLVCPVSPKEANWLPVGLKFQTLLKLFIRQACSSINHQPKQFTFKAPPTVECTAIQGSA